MTQNILIIGNSDGIGAAVTRTLLSRGDRIVGISRSANPLGPDGPKHFVQDVAAPDYPNLLHRIIAEEGPFDACIFCAAIGSGLKLPDFSHEVYVIEVNFTAMVRTLAMLLPGWLKEGQGHFIGLSSLADDFYNAKAPSYTASKAGFSNYLVSMAIKLKPHGVHITNIRFGFVDTKLPKASWKPLMLSTDQAAHQIIKCLQKKPIQLSIPKLAGLALYGFRWMQSFRIWTS